MNLDDTTFNKIKKKGRLPKDFTKQDFSNRIGFADSTQLRDDNLPTDDHIPAIINYPHEFIGIYYYCHSILMLEKGMQEEDIVLNKENFEEATTKFFGQEDKKATAHYHATFYHKNGKKKLIGLWSSIKKEADALTKAKRTYAASIRKIELKAKNENETHIWDYYLASLKGATMAEASNFLTEEQDYHLYFFDKEGTLLGANEKIGQLEDGTYNIGSYQSGLLGLQVTQANKTYDHIITKEEKSRTSIVEALRKKCSIQEGCYFDKENIGKNVYASEELLIGDYSYDPNIYTSSVEVILRSDQKERLNKISPFAERRPYWYVKIIDEKGGKVAEKLVYEGDGLPYAFPDLWEEGHFYFERVQDNGTKKMHYVSEHSLEDFIDKNLSKEEKKKGEITLLFSRVFGTLKLVKDDRGSVQEKTSVNLVKVSSTLKNYSEKYADFYMYEKNPENKSDLKNPFDINRLEWKEEEEKIIYLLAKKGEYNLKIDGKDYSFQDISPEKTLEEVIGKKLKRSKQYRISGIPIKPNPKRKVVGTYENLKNEPIYFLDKSYSDLEMKIFSHHTKWYWTHSFWEDTAKASILLIVLGSVAGVAIWLLDKKNKKGTPPKKAEKEAKTTSKNLKRSPNRKKHGL